MKILVIGGNSSLGKSLVPVLSKYNKVITTGRTEGDFYFSLTGKIGEIVLEYFNGIDIIINLAGAFKTDTEYDIRETEEINVLGTLRVCWLAKELKAKHLILISTTHVDTPSTSDYYNAYTISKKHAEEIATYYCKCNYIPLTILRPSQIYGTEAFRKHQKSFYTIIDMAEWGKSIVLRGTNDALRNFIHIDDLTTIIELVISTETTGTYMCAYPTNITLTHICKAAYNAFRQKELFCFDGYSDDIPSNVFSNDNSLYDKINFFPQISIEQGMRMIAKQREIK